MLKVKLNEAYSKAEFEVYCELIAERLFGSDYSRKSFSQLLNTGPRSPTPAISWLEWYFQEAKYPVEKIFGLFKQTKNAFQNRPELFSFLLKPTRNRFFSFEPIIPLQEVLLQIKAQKRKLFIKRILFTGFAEGFHFLTHYNEKGLCDNVSKSWFEVLEREDILSSFRHLSVEAITNLLKTPGLYSEYFGDQKVCIQSLKSLLENPNAFEMKGIIISLCESHAITREALRLACSKSYRQTNTLNDIFYEIEPNKLSQQILTFFFAPASLNEELYLPHQAKNWLKTSFGPITSFEEFEKRFASLKQSMQEEMYTQDRKMEI